MSSLKKGGLGGSESCGQVFMQMRFFPKCVTRGRAGEQHCTGGEEPRFPQMGLCPDASKNSKTLTTALLQSVWLSCGVRALAASGLDLFSIASALRFACHSSFSSCSQLTNYLCIFLLKFWKESVCPSELPQILLDRTFHTKLLFGNRAAYGWANLGPGAHQGPVSSQSLFKGQFAQFPFQREGTMVAMLFAKSG